MEAQLRLAYLKIRQPRLTPLKDDDPKLSELSSVAGDVRFGYLASMFLGLAAEKRTDLSAAAVRYERARAVGPQWPSARYALASVLFQQGHWELAQELLQGGSQVDLSDPWYGFACTIMTTDALAELRVWERKERSRE
jgi:hypothetical protein